MTFSVIFILFTPDNQHAYCLQKTIATSSTVYYILLDVCSWFPIYVAYKITLLIPPYCDNLHNYVRLLLSTAL